MRRVLDGFRIAALDFETDPFKHGRVPRPFAGGFYAGGGHTYFDTWGPDCVADLFRQIMALENRYLIYVHNGGRFDFHFLWDWIEEPVMIIKNRLVEFSLGVTSKGPKHVVRDSLSIIPVPLEEYRKDIKDLTKEERKAFYKRFEKETRERHRSAIRDYLRSDCRNLWEITSKFHESFGLDDGKTLPPLTAGQAAMKELRSFHKFDRMTVAQDATFRPFYFGGRNQCFAAGILEGPWEIYDVNSAFPKAMRDCDHPSGSGWDERDRMPRSTKKPYFVEFIGRNHNAIPMRIEETQSDAEGAVISKMEKIEFAIPEGHFFACSHELIPALDMRRVEIDKIIAVWIPDKVIRFDSFVDHWYAEKKAAKLAGDKPGEIFAKLILNSSYGKFGQNPHDYLNYALLRDVFQDWRMRCARHRMPGAFLDPECRECYHCEMRIRPDLELWARPAYVHDASFYNVAIAASITSAARAILLKGLNDAEEPIYCDTDSVICRKFRGTRSPTELGAWKFEGRARFAAIAGRKTYCVFDRFPGKIESVKHASKGGDLEPIDIIRVASGERVEKPQEAPTFSLVRAPSFTTRRFRKTLVETGNF